MTTEQIYGFIFGLFITYEFKKINSFLLIEIIGQLDV